MDDDALASDGPELSKLRRFAFGVALGLAVFVLSGASVREEVQVPVIGLIKIEHLNVLVLLLFALSIYASVRYLYYCIWAPVTRLKIRQSLMNDTTLLLAKMPESDYREALKAVTNKISNEHVRLERICLPGLTPWHFIVFTDYNKQPDEDLIRHLLANRVDRYFPGIGPSEIKIKYNAGDHVLALVGPLKPATLWRSRLEDLDLYLPLIANGLALFVFVIFKAVPWLWQHALTLLPS